MPELLTALLTLLTFNTSEMSGEANTVTLAQLPSTSSSSGACGSSDDHSDLPSITSIGSRASVLLHEICQSASSSEIQLALSASGGSVDEAAQRLLGEEIYYEQL